MWNWENGIAKNDYYSRYIASYRYACVKTGVPFLLGMFRRWLEDLGLDGNDIQNIVEMATNGKLEYQEHAKKFIESRIIK